jgi:uncharacterized protein with PQ loop repeat
MWLFLSLSNNSNMFNDLVGYMLALASTLTVVSIPVKLFKTRDREGVSYLTSALAFYSMVAWAGYTMNLGDIPAFFSSIGPMICWGLSLIGLSLASKRRGVLYYTSSLTILLSGLILVRLGSTILSILAVGGSLLWSLPQLKKAFASDSLSGVSGVGYLLIFLENLGWVIYALLTRHYAYAFAPLIQGPSSLYIGIKALKEKKKEL